MKSQKTAAKDTTGVGLPLNFVDNSCFKMARERLSCVQTALLLASYDNLFLKAKRVICSESMSWYVVEKRFARRPANRIRKILLDLHVQISFSKIFHTAHVQLMKRKRKCKSQVRIKHHPDGSSKIITVFSALINLLAGVH